MQEVWLKTNRRAILFGLVLPLVIIGIGLWLMFGAERGTDYAWPGALVSVFGAIVLFALLRQIRRPRIAFRDGHVLFYVRSGQPIAVPVDIVESFFAGQSEAHLPGFANQPQSVNLIARLRGGTPSGLSNRSSPPLVNGAIATSRFAGRGASRWARK